MNGAHRMPGERSDIFYRTPVRLLDVLRGLREERVAEERPGALLVPPLPLCESTLITLEGEPRWYLGMAADFAGAARNVERAAYECLLDAVARIAEEPLTGAVNIPSVGYEEERQCVWTTPACDIIYGVDMRARHITLWKVRTTGHRGRDKTRRQPHYRSP